MASRRARRRRLPASPKQGAVAIVAGIKLTRAEVAARLTARGFTLLGPYTNNRTPTLARCDAHGLEGEVYPGNLMRGQRMMCCGNVGRREARSGQQMPAETRARLSNAVKGEAHPNFGRSRLPGVRAKVSASLTRTARSGIEYPILKARTGKNAGRSGFFYIARMEDGRLKFGSTTQAPRARAWGLFKEYRQGARVVIAAKVPDAGGYEAAMMEAHRRHWLGGEFFGDFLSEQPARD